MMNKEQEDRLTEFINRLDDVIKDFPEMGAHNVAGALLSRVTLLMTMDPAVGKGLLKYVWEQLDIIEQADPGSML